MYMLKLCYMAGQVCCAQHCIYRLNRIIGRALTISKSWVGLDCFGSFTLPSCVKLKVSLTKIKTFIWGGSDNINVLPVQAAETGQGKGGGVMSIQATETSCGGAMLLMY